MTLHAMPTSIAKNNKKTASSLHGTNPHKLAIPHVGTCSEKFHNLTIDIVVAHYDGSIDYISQLASAYNTSHNVHLKVYTTGNTLKTYYK